MQCRSWSIQGQGWNQIESIVYSSGEEAMGIELGEMVACWVLFERRYKGFAGKKMSSQCGCWVLCLSSTDQDLIGNLELILIFAANPKRWTFSLFWACQALAVSQKVVTWCSFFEKTATITKSDLPLRNQLFVYLFFYFFKDHWVSN